MLINIFLILFIIILLIILSWVWPPDSPWSPWWRTSAKKAFAAAELARITSKDKVYELGSGDATFLVTVAKKFECKCFGIEIDPTRHLIGWLNVKVNGVGNKVTLKRGNFLDHNLNAASIVFVYLVPRVLEKIKPKLSRELKKGTKIISYRYKFKETKSLKLVAADKKNEIYFYKII
jgi:predicted RNA methylase